MENCIIYALVSFGEKPLAQYSTFQGQFLEIFQKNLNSIEAHTSRGFKIDDNYMIYYINENNITYLIIADLKFSKASALSFLKNIEKEFLSVYADTDLNTVEKFGLDEEFKEILKKKYEYYNERKEITDETLENYKDQIIKLCDRILDASSLLDDRAEKLSILDNKHERLTKENVKYYKSSKRVKKERKKRIIYISVGITIAILVILYVLLSIICGSWIFQC